MKIQVLKDYTANFEDDVYTIDLNRKFDGFEPGDLICYACPFSPAMPLQLELAIRADGSLIFRSWKFIEGEGNHYLHTRELSEADCKGIQMPFTPTEAQTDTVNGLFSGRIKFEGLKLAVGSTLQRICPIDLQREEKLIGEKIYLT